MSEFQEQLHEAFGARAQIKSNGGPHWSRAALEEFAEWIEKESGGRVWAAQNRRRTKGSSGMKRPSAKRARYTTSRGRLDRSVTRRGVPSSNEPV